METNLNSPTLFLLLTLNSMISLLIVIIFAFFFGKKLLRYSINRIVDHAINLIATEKYTQNIFELVTSFKRASVLNVLELELRAQSQGKNIERPLGSPKQFPSYDMLMFAPSIMTNFSLPESTKIDMQVTIGKSVAKPLTIDIPLIIGGMAYGLAISEEIKIAIARAAKTMNTVVSSGEGPLLPEERQAAGKYILQISRWPWGGRTDEQIANADMLEVQMGQGAEMGTIRIEAMQGKAQSLAGLLPGQSVVSLPAPPGITSPDDWPRFMADLRRRANGIPIALKVMATGRLEEDLAVVVNLGFDAVILDGAQGGSHGSSPIKQDDFGIPTLNALVRANRFLIERGVRQQISLITTGGYFTPGACLKALALGADAVALGSIIMMGASGHQAYKVIPFEPPNTIAYYESPADTKKLDIDKAASNVVNLLTSMMTEMEEAMRALGKSSLRELGPEDLVALDTYTADVTGVKRVY